MVTFCEDSLREDDVEAVLATFCVMAIVPTLLRKSVEMIALNQKYDDKCFLSVTVSSR